MRFFCSNWNFFFCFFGSPAIRIFKKLISFNNHLYLLKLKTYLESFFNALFLQYFPITNNNIKIVPNARITIDDTKPIIGSASNNLRDPNIDSGVSTFCSNQIIGKNTAGTPLYILKIITILRINSFKKNFFFHYKLIITKFQNLAVEKYLFANEPPPLKVFPNSIINFSHLYNNF